ncbi:general stress protein [Corynebacterium callunae]|uniref:general stress protein n=1 Tax=Corynebacterium callunae TaxID=1721 RepID=UPI003981F67C
MATQNPDNKALILQKTRPEGWPVGSFQTYSEAQAAVDYLSDNDFPVSELTIVGVDLMEVERVTGRLTWGRVIAGGAASGAWLGVFFGSVLALMSGDWVSSLAIGLFMGIIFGTVGVAVPYAATRGKRDFTSSTQIVAGRYDVICSPQRAPEARDMIARKSAEFKA